MARTYIGLKAWDMGFDAHLTLVYLGRDVTEQQAYEIEEYLRSLNNPVLYVIRHRITMFSRKTPVVIVSGEPALIELQADLEGKFWNMSDFPFQPHISLKLNHNETIHIPEVIKLDKLGLY